MSELSKLADSARMLGMKEGASHPATEEHYKAQRDAEWVAAIDEMVEHCKHMQRDMMKTDLMRAYYGAKVEAYNELKTRMEAKK